MPTREYRSPEALKIADPVEIVTPGPQGLQVRLLAQILEQLRQMNQKLDALLKQKEGTP